MTEKSEAMLLQHEKNGEGIEDTLNDGVAERSIIKEKENKSKNQRKIYKIKTKRKFQTVAIT